MKRITIYITKFIDMVTLKFLPTSSFRYNHRNTKRKEITTVIEIVTLFPFGCRR